jgi:hypothetical protein
VGLNFSKFNVIYKIILIYVAYFMHCIFETQIGGGGSGVGWRVSSGA